MKDLIFSMMFIALLTIIPAKVLLFIFAALGYFILS